MRTFRTSDGVEWQVAVNVGTVKRVRDLTSVNLLDLVGNHHSISELFSDDVRFAEVLCAVVRPQLEAAGKSDDQFFAAINGDVIETAAEALLAEVVNFFQEPRRSLLQKAMEKYRTAALGLQEKGLVEVQKRLDEMDVEQMILKFQTPTNSASSLPDSAA
jgi:hypothetical protein